MHIEIKFGWKVSNLYLCNCQTPKAKAPAQMDEKKAIPIVSLAFFSVGFFSMLISKPFFSAGLLPLLLLTKRELY